VALVNAGIGLVMMLIASPKVPYADTWRFLTAFLETPFPDNVLGADNGHREVLPNAIRVAELHWLDANQWLQVLLGIYMAVLACAGIWRASKGTDKNLQAATAATIAVGIFWLGNSRKTAHGSESIHLFLVMLCLIHGVRLLLSDHVRRGWYAGGLGLVASLSFGSGAASFAAFLVVLWLRREPLLRYAQVMSMAAVGALFVMLGNDGAIGSKNLELVAHIDQVMRWLGAPFAWVLSPALDPAHAERLPLAPLRAVFEPIATFAQDTFGPARMNRWPGALFGAAGTIWLALATYRARSNGDTNRIRLFALGLAWFGFAVGLLVVLARCGFFLRKPDQIIAQRYLPWSMLMWTGLLLTFVHADSSNTKRKLLAVLFAALAFAPSQIWTGRYAFRRQAVAEQTAVATAVGVLNVDYWTVESVPEQLLRAAPLLRDAKKTVWSWPEVQLLGQPAPTTAKDVAVTDLTITPIKNLYPGEGCDVTFTCQQGNGLLLLVDTNGIVQGLAMRNTQPKQWLGWVRGRNHTHLRVITP